MQQLFFVGGAVIVIRILFRYKTGWVLACVEKK